MGVTGLKTFVFENRKQLLKELKLRKTKLIIDGNGICHKLYYNNLKRNSDCFGGNYDEFEIVCENFFRKLSDCEIEPYVFFDGVQEPDKDETTSARRKERTKRQRPMSKGKPLGENARLLPILSYETFKSVLIKKEIHHETSIWESDPQMAIAAKEKDCPILTCDSDFFIYDIPKGVIVVDHLDLTKFKKCEEIGNYMEVEIYHISDLMFHMGPEVKDNTMIALLATVLGNDWMSKHEFQDFFEKNKLPEKCNNLKDRTDQKKVLKALGWLQSKEKLIDAISDLIADLQQDQKEQVEKNIMMSIEKYTNLESETESNSSSWFASKNLPKWFVDDFRECKMPVPALAAVIGRPIFLPSQVSDMSKPSPYQCCLSARKFMYRLLFEPAAKPNITEFDRDESDELKKQEFCLEILVDDNKSIRCLDEIPDLSNENRFAIFMENLDLPLKLLELFPNDAHLLIAAIMLWLRNVELKVDRRRYLYTLLACFLRNGKFDSCLNVSGAATSHLRFRTLDKFFNVHSENNKDAFDCNVVHVFSQFQCCLQTVIYLSQILLRSPEAIHLVTGFNGTFLYNFYRELCTVESDPEHFMQNLLDRDAKLFQSFNEIRRMI